MIPNVYNFDPLTGEYTSTALADPSPLEPGRYLVPGFATFLPPPAAGAHQVAVFAAGRWHLRADYRRAVLYSTASGERVQVSAIDDAPVEATAVPPPGPAYEWDREAAAWVQNDAKAAVVAKQAAQAAINRLEGTQLLPRVTREFMLLSLEAQATPEQLAKLASYVKVKAFDDEIAALRAIIRAAK